MPDTSDTRPQIAGFLDTNVFVRYLADDHPEFSPLSREVFEQIERGELVAYITDTVVFETAYVLEKRYQATRRDIADAMLRLLRLPGLGPANKETLRETFDLWVSRANLSFADCFHLMSAKSMGLDIMITFDRKMSIEGVTRVEPPLG
jgi:predicted nucleic acid-binding protein